MSYPGELLKAYEALMTHDLEPKVVICSVCGCVLGVYKIEKPCKHFRELLKDEPQ